jgi:cytochrome c-type biogenesis protein CcmE
MTETVPTAKGGKLLNVGLTVVVLGGCIGYLLVTSAAQGISFYKDVHELTPSPQAWTGKNLKLRGIVVDGSIRSRIQNNTTEREFQLVCKGKVMTVRHKGIVPDTFKDGAEVVADGQVDVDGEAFTASDLIAKCPSKYEDKRSGEGMAGCK